MPSCASPRPTCVNARRVNFLACLGREEIMAPAIAVEAQWKPPDGEYFRQAAEARERPLFLHQKGRVDLVGRIIEGDDQIQSAIESRDPAMSGAVLVQHHSG